MAGATEIDRLRGLVACSKDPKEQAECLESLAELEFDAGQFESSAKSAAEGLKLNKSERLFAAKALSEKSLGRMEDFRLTCLKASDLFPKNRLFSASVTPEASPVERKSEVPVNLSPGLAAPDPSQLDALGAMSDDQIEAVLNAMERPGIKEQLEKVSGRSVSSQELASMKSMMNPAMIRSVLGMYKNNPSMFASMAANQGKSFPSPPSMNCPIPPPMNSPMPPPSVNSPMAPSSMNSPLSAPMNSPFGPGMGAPGFGTLLENKDMILTMLSTVRENPKMILGMIDPEGRSPLSQISETTLKRFASVIYYLLKVVLETIAFLRAHKVKLLLLMIAWLLYRNVYY